MTYQSNRTKLLEKMVKRRSLFDGAYALKGGYQTLIIALFSSQGRFIAWTLANYLIVVLEILALQHFLSIFVFATSLQILRFISFLSLFPLFLLLALGNRETLEFDSKHEEQQVPKHQILDKKEINLAAAQFLFGIKSICALVIVAITFNSKTFMTSVPEVVQVLVFTRLLSAPWDSTFGFLMMRKRKIFIHPHPFISRTFSVLLDILGVVFLVSLHPIIYFIFHLSVRILRTNFVTKAILNKPFLSLTIIRNQEWLHIRLLSKFLAKNIGLPFATVVISECIFFLLTHETIIDSPLYSQLVFLVHTHYHVAIIISLRFLRRRLADFTITRYFLNLKSKLLEYSAWRRVGLIATILSAPAALLSITPFLFLTALSPSGEVISISKQLIFWPIIVGFSRVLSTLIAAASIHSKLQKQLSIFLLMLVALVSSLFWIYFISTLRLSEEDILSFSLLSDSLFNLVFIVAGSTIILRYKEKRELPLVDFLIESKGEVRGQIINLTWRKGVSQKSLISQAILSKFTYQELRIDTRHSCFLFDASQLIDLTLVVNKLAPFIEEYNYKKAINHIDLLNLISKNRTGLISPQGKFIKKLEDGFDLSKIKSPEDSRKYKDYFIWAYAHGLYYPLSGSNLKKNYKVHILENQFHSVELKYPGGKE